MLSSTFSPLAALVAGLALVNQVAAVPTEPRAETVPEVIPGPGLPSLAELGVTSEELYAMALPEDLVRRSSNSLQARFDPLCGPDDYYYTNVNGIIACINYLTQALSPSQRCEADSQPRNYCVSGDAKITAQSIGGDTSSTCTEAARGAVWVIDHCTRPDQSVAGYNAAWGNGNLIVGAVNTRI